jgi:hypothetical protein
VVGGVAGGAGDVADAALAVIGAGLAGESVLVGVETHWALG